MFGLFSRHPKGKKSQKQIFKEAGEPILAAATARANEAGRTEPLYADVMFHRANDAVRAAIAHLSPSGSNGRADTAGLSIISALKGAGVEPDEYWTDVWLRSGKKDLDDYNEADKSVKRGATSDQLTIAISKAAAAVPRQS